MKDQGLAVDRYLIEVFNNDYFENELYGCESYHHLDLDGEAMDLLYILLDKVEAKFDTEGVAL